jgi:hypothetical protein
MYMYTCVYICTYKHTCIHPFIPGNGRFLEATSPLLSAKQSCFRITSKNRPSLTLIHLEETWRRSQNILNLWVRSYMINIFWHTQYITKLYYKYQDWWYHDHMPWYLPPWYTNFCSRKTRWCGSSIERTLRRREPKRGSWKHDLKMMRKISQKFDHHL